MMNTTAGRGAVVVLLVLFAACGSSGPTSPTGINPPSALPPPTPPTPTEFPPLSGPSRTFIFDSELTYRLRSAMLGWRLDVGDYTRNSRFVLYDNGAFLLQYPPSRFGEVRYRGAYQDANGAIMFLFEGSAPRRVGSPWDDATGTLTGDSLTVRYSEIMQHADFEDAVYVLMP